MPTIGSDIVLDGEKEFRQQLESINAGLRVLGSELKKTEAGFIGNESSVEALSKKNEVLNRTLAEQEKKEAALRAELTKASEAYGESDVRTLRMTDRLTRAETAVIKTKTAIQQNTKAMEQGSKATDDLGKKITSLGDGVDKLADAVGVRLPSGLSKYLSGIDSATAKTALFTGVAIKLVSTLVDASVKTAASADEILTLASTTGMSTEQIQVLKYAAEGLDVSFETISSAQTKMIRSMNEAREGTGDAAEAYQQLGIKITDSNGQLRDSNVVFRETVDRLKTVGNETERDALSMSIFGKSARELNPLIEAGGAALDEWAQKAKDAGIIMDESTLEKYGELDNAMQMFKQSQIALTQTLGTVLLPVLTGVFTIISKIPPDVVKVVVVIAAVVAGVVAIINVIKTVNSTVGAVKGMLSVTNTKMLKTTAIILGVVAALILLAIAIAAITGKAREMRETLAAASNAAGSFNSGTPRYAAGTDYHPGGLATVGEQGEETIWLPPGTKVFPHRETMQLRRSIPAYANGTGSFGNVYHISIEARSVREFNDIVRVAEEKRVSTRKGYTRR